MKASTRFTKTPSMSKEEFEALKDLKLTLPLKINYGCGETRLRKFLNIDIEPSVKPDLVCDLRYRPFPLRDECADLIQCIHNIEHIEYKFWPQIFYEFHRVLKPEGRLYLAYPEFEICAKNFVTNEKGMRDFWRATLYGRQLYPGDFHVNPMVTSEVMDILEQCGFHNIKSAPEPMMEYNTFLTATRGKIMPSRADLLKKEIFTKTNVVNKPKR